MQGLIEFFWIELMKMNCKSPSFPCKPYLYYSVVADTLHFFFPAMNYNYTKVIRRMSLSN